MTVNHSMVGKMRSCQGCGAPMRKDYEYCNVCGRKTCAPPKVHTTGAASPPKVLPAPVPRSMGGAGKQESLVPRRELVIALLSMTIMAPFCTWLSSLGGLIGICAAFNEAFYGRYVVLLAAVGLLTVMGGNLLPASIPRKAIMAGVGIGTVALTALDYAEIVRYNLTSSPLMLQVVPGIGMYMAFALGIAISLAVLVPKRRRVPFASERPVLRPGSPGSGPSARR